MTLAEARETPFAFPGGYAILAVMDDGEYLCHKCLVECDEIHEDGEDDGWRFVGAEAYWEGPSQQCANCYAEIRSEYGDPNANPGEESAC